MNFKLKPFPRLETKRLVLRKTSINDSEEILFLRSDKEVNQYIKRPETIDIKDAQEFIKKITKGMDNGENINWSICLKGSSKMIGSICLWSFSEDKKMAEVGYDLHPKFQNIGIMSEALMCILDFGFNKLGFIEIEAYTHFANESSKRLLTKNMFKLIKNKKDKYNKDNLVYAIKKSKK